MQPASEHGNRFALTLVDYATRYPEAVPLKNETAETVAEALVGIFSRVGVPKEIVSDQGPQLMSGVMKEVSRLLSVKQLVTTPYHPMYNGLVERFNGILKTMIVKMCQE
jgi:transposase InsO family protein